MRDDFFRLHCCCASELCDIQRLCLWWLFLPFILAPHWRGHVNRSVWSPRISVGLECTAASDSAAGATGRGQSW